MSDSPDWKKKFYDLMDTCQEELKKTAEVGKKMLVASKTNSDLKECYEKLGRLMANGIKNGEIKLESEEVLKIMDNIQRCESELEDMESEVQKIKLNPTDTTKSENNSN